MKLNLVKDKDRLRQISIAELDLDVHAPAHDTAMQTSSLSCAFLEIAQLDSFGLQRIELSKWIGHSCSWVPKTCSFLFHTALCATCGFASLAPWSRSAVAAEPEQLLALRSIGQLFCL